MADPKSVLLVEDEDNIALALEYIIGRKGYALKRVDSGEGALASLREAPPDADGLAMIEGVLQVAEMQVRDVMIPRGSGFEVCQHIREDADLSGTKILMISAAGEMARRKGLALGADAFFVKPFDTRQLMDEVSRLLEECDAA